MWLENNTSVTLQDKKDALYEAIKYQSYVVIVWLDSLSNVPEIYIYTENIDYLEENECFKYLEIWLNNRINELTKFQKYRCSSVLYVSFIFY